MTTKRKIDFNISTPIESTCIIVYGNIASGKTTFSKKIQSLLADFEYVCMDAIRIANHEQYPTMNGFERERKCEKDCLTKLFESKLLIYETTAASQLFKKVILKLSNNFKTIYVHIDCPIEKCYWRFNDRERTTHIKIPIPYDQTKHPLKQLMYDIEDEYYDIEPDLRVDSLKSSPDEMILEFKMFFNL